MSITLTEQLLIYGFCCRAAGTSVDLLPCLVIFFYVFFFLFLFIFIFFLPAFYLVDNRRDIG